MKPIRGYLLLYFFATPFHHLTNVATLSRKMLFERSKEKLSISLNVASLFISHLAARKAGCREHQQWNEKQSGRFCFPFEILCIGSNHHNYFLLTVINWPGIIFITLIAKSSTGKLVNGIFFQTKKTKAVNQLLCVNPFVSDLLRGVTTICFISCK